MIACQWCQVWLCEIVKTLYTAHSPFPRQGETLQVLNLKRERDAKDVFANHRACWFCARIWARERIRKPDMLMTDLETLEDSDNISIEILVQKTLSLDMRKNKGLTVTHAVEGRTSIHRPCFEFRVMSKGVELPGETSLSEQQKTSKAVMELKYWKSSTNTTMMRIASTMPDNHARANPGVRSTNAPFKTIDRIRGWIGKCQKGHRRCGKLQSSNSTKLPTRLLYIGGGPKFRLVDTLGLPEKPKVRYATLSHCWGTEPFETLTTDNLDNAREGMAISGLPKTFREAIYLCRALRIRYIWIDSWCIIQNSDQDWQHEAPLMMHVYGGSFLAISAAVSNGPSLGLHRTSQKLLSTDLEIILPGGLRASTTATNELNLPGDLFRASPAFSRGWIVQEMYLSPRTLYVTDIQMYWACSESFSGEFTGEIKNSDLQLFLFNVANSEKVKVEGNRQPGEEAIDERWMDLACHYSRTQTTNLKDRVIALSGLVDRFESIYRPARVQTFFLLGCWTHTFAKWLTWSAARRVRLDVGSRRIGRLPSWSWMSFQGGVRFEVFHTADFGPLLLKCRLELELASEIPAAEKLIAIQDPLLVHPITVKAPLFVISIVQDWNHSGIGSLLEKLPYYPKDVYCLSSSKSDTLFLPSDSRDISDHRLTLCDVRASMDYKVSQDWSKPTTCALTCAATRALGSYDFYAIILDKVEPGAGHDTVSYQRTGLLKFMLRYGDDGRDFMRKRKDIAARRRNDPFLLDGMRKFLDSTRETFVLQ